MPELDKPTIAKDQNGQDNWNISVVWAEVEPDRPPFSPIPPTRRFDCFVRFSVSATFAVGELFLAAMKANQGSQPPMVTQGALGGDFSRQQDVTITGEFKVGSTAFLNFMNGGNVMLRLEITTQTTRGQAELKHPDGQNFGVKDREVKVFKYEHPVHIPPPPPLQLAGASVPVPSGVARED